MSEKTKKRYEKTGIKKYIQIPKHIQIRQTPSAFLNNWKNQQKTAVNWTCLSKSVFDKIKFFVIQKTCTWQFIIKWEYINQ